MDYNEFDKRDTCLQISHYYWAKSVLWEDILNDDNIFNEMYTEECKLDTALHSRKNKTYNWSNSDGLTKWLYKKVLHYFNIDPYKGLNGDQLRALFLYVYYNRRSTRCKLIRNKVLLGYILRLGFAPSLMEHCLFKPQAYVLLLKSFDKYYLNPLYWVSRLFFHFSMKKNLKEKIKGHTTNKITLIPTMYYLGYELPNKEYTDEVYRRYYDGELEQLMKKAVDYLRSL